MITARFASTKTVRRWLALKSSLTSPKHFPNTSHSIQAFYLITGLIELYGMKKIWQVCNLNVEFYILEKLVELKLPKLLKHFNTEGVKLEMVCTGWMVTLFTMDFNSHDNLLQIFDAFMVERWSIVYRMCLSILLRLQPRLLRCDLEGILKTMRECKSYDDKEEMGFWKLVEKIDVNEGQIRKLKERYKAEGRETPSLNDSLDSLDISFEE